ncbi:MAG TPA: DUF3109 family protein [Saprospiraceae bacterium]|nr:DUF3109 family protein [Saprospiraceae bacterium]
MLIVKGKLIGDEILQEHFLCNLEACKGACCWEGDWGAPLESTERQTLERIYDDLKPYLSPEGRRVLEEEGLFTYYKDAKDYGTPLIKNGACAYMTYTEEGIATCGIEQAYHEGKTDFRKPISCHLYPIRINREDKTGFEALNYDRWDICSAACQKGKEQQMPIYQFAKAALIRKYGAEFYAELEAAAQHLNS